MAVKLGQFVKDIITGATGEAVARTEWKYGCVRVTVQPRKQKNSAPVDTFTVDEPQLEVIDEQAAPEVAPAHGPREDVGRAPDPM